MHLISLGEIILRLFSIKLDKIAYDNTVWTLSRMYATLVDRVNSMNSRSGRVGWVD